MSQKEIKKYHRGAGNNKQTIEMKIPTDAELLAALEESKRQRQEAAE